MKKMIAALAILLMLTCVLPLATFAEEAGTEATTEAVTETAAETTAETSSESLQKTCACATASDTPYCPVCGGINPAYEKDHWDCPVCDAKELLTPFCPQCGEKHPDRDRFWTCAECGLTDNFYDACNRCGASPADANAGPSFKIDIDSLKETLPIMGMGMLGIFLVIGTIAITVMILRKLPEKKKEE